VRRALLAAAFTALAALAPAPAVRAAEMPDGKWWKNPRVTAELGVTREQADEIEKIFVRSRSKLIDLKAGLEKRQLDLQVAMDDKTADRGAVEKKIEAVENARAALQKTRALMILDMKQVLKPEQWERLVQKQHEWREQMQERRRMFREDGGRPRPGPQGRRPNG
jgi:Spy/CpxP family protein refolding chaperone